MPNIGATELILILLVVLLLFGAKRLPDLSRSVGRSLRILKSETKALHTDDDDEPRPAARPAPAAELGSAPAADPSTPPLAQPGSPSVTTGDGRDTR
jgi:sec-independent protein translocase protein TatA